eukprot:CAMPEP_0118669312 /NCGR_PEP_ID=MMETSP0785-20121206/20828_1 /TAXON_ID=91992 /ORGANISM="Bolidomonas pacifica, Strain CCMP 1866" /LENGTH=226 /DNA_ID=CAMNT_0006563975 /DNA_START=29 /DNA_END=708 /DNA_ORIENTATION=-
MTSHRISGGITEKRGGSDHSFVADMLSLLSFAPPPDALDHPRSSEHSVVHDALPRARSAVLEELVDGGHWSERDWGQVVADLERHKLSDSAINVDRAVPDEGLLYKIQSVVTVLINSNPASIGSLPILWAAITSQRTLKCSSKCSRHLQAPHEPRLGRADPVQRRSIRLTVDKASIIVKGKDEAPIPPVTVWPVEYCVNVAHALLQIDFLHLDPPGEAEAGDAVWA